MSGMNGKPKLAMYWAASCGGCEIAVLNTGEKVLDIAANFEVAFWPLVIDAKVKDVEALPDGGILLTLFNGGIRTKENEEMAHLLRRKSQILVAFGACACAGGIPGLANLSSARDVFDTAYNTISTYNPEQVRPQPSWEAPEGELRIPAFQPVLRTLGQVVPVNYYMPGCPPESHQVAAVVDQVVGVLRGEASLPPTGSIIGAAVTTVCDECARTRHEKAISQFVRIHDLPKTDPTLCLLEQGIPCNGPATLGGCEAPCPKAGAQCIGCGGPPGDTLDYGARLLSAFASVIDSTDPEEIERILDGIPDPVGQFYRFSLANSLLRAGRPAWQNS